MSAAPDTDAARIRADYEAARSTGLRARDAARQIGLSEGAVLAAHAGPHDQPLQALPLRGDWLALLQALEPCGSLMALTRNESVVHEKHGTYRQVSAQGAVALVLDREIDLRLFLDHWHAGFAVLEAGRSPSAPLLRSLQFFNAHGRAVHKIYAREATDREALEAVIQRFAQAGARPQFEAGAEAADEPQERPDADAAGFLAGWSQMKDTHEFFGLMQRFGLPRQQSLRLAEGRFTWRLEPGAVEQVLRRAARTQTSIMVFVGSGGCIQIHTGPVHRIDTLQGPGGDWLNVLDAGFNLHLRSDHVAEVWRVEKPTGDGLVTSIEVFSARGELLAMFFGERKPGQPELAEWRQLVAALPRLAGEPA